ncbi:uncharacterized protein TNCV_1572911 [Trichonephila clavipes]|uniref:Transposase n=1 Tax=Trichonephila clavipes TaxID=2585209 RepID=A0A8X6SQB6_TRICX|nr:uncharacterized protein TNCV_1572911 [Trichonephila clavipes]
MPLHRQMPDGGPRNSSLQRAKRRLSLAVALSTNHTGDSTIWLDSVPINGDRYRAMISNFFIPELNNHDVQELWFQQDSATCHTARATIDLLKDTFGDRLISRFGPVNWPPRSCDLTLLDYFLWGYVKSLVYADKPQTLDHLEDNICRVIADIRPQMLEKVIENWTSRLDYIRASRGSPMPEIIFKMYPRPISSNQKTLPNVANNGNGSRARWNALILDMTAFGDIFELAFGEIDRRCNKYSRHEFIRWSCVA